LYLEAGVFYATITTLNTCPPSTTITNRGQLVSSVNGREAIKTVTADGSEEGLRGEVADGQIGKE
jgi:hypothetical protein